MSQTTPGFDFIEQQRAGSAVFTNALFNQGTEAMLAAQAAMFVNGEGVLMAWLNRRHEAILDMQRLFARMRECRDISEAMQAQQEWMSGTLKRLTDDAASCQQAMQAMISAAAPDASEIAHPKPADILRHAANDGKPAASHRGPGLKTAGER
jgi:hypothetical protein